MVSKPICMNWKSDAFLSLLRQIREFDVVQDRSMLTLCWISVTYTLSTKVSYVLSEIHKVVHNKSASFRASKVPTRELSAETSGLLCPRSMSLSTYDANRVSDKSIMLLRVPLLDRLLIATQSNGLVHIRHKHCKTSGLHCVLTREFVLRTECPKRC